MMKELALNPTLPLNIITASVMMITVMVMVNLTLWIDRMRLSLCQQVEQVMTLTQASSLLVITVLAPVAMAAPESCVDLIA